MSIDLEAIKRKVQQLQTGRKLSNVQLWKPDPGSYTVRAMPWPAASLKDGSPFIERWMYYIGENRGALTAHQFGQPDPINEFVSRLY